MEGDSAHSHKPLQAQRRLFHPPETVPPSQDTSALPRQFRPPESHKKTIPALPSPIQEGDFVYRGRFCAPPHVALGTTRTVPPSRDSFTLQSG